MTLKSEQLDDRDIPDKTCKTCKYWKLINKMGDCIKTVHGWREMAASGTDWDTCKASGQFDGGIITGPDFGCLHHEFKETP